MISELTWGNHVFPHPRGRLPLIGDLRPRALTEPILECARAVDGLGPICEYQAGPIRFVFASTVEGAEPFLDETTFEKKLPAIVRPLRRLAGDGLFTAANDEPNWQLAHDILMPAFTKSAMIRYHATMLEVLDELLAKWDSAAAAGTPVDVNGDLTRMTLETITRCAFTADFGSFASERQHPFIALMVNALAASHRQAFLDNVPVVGGTLSALDRVKDHAKVTRVTQMVDDLVAKRKAAIAAGADPGDDILALMLATRHPQTGERLSDDNVRNQILTFLVAGHETTSGMLAFALHYLSQDPRLADKPRREAAEIFGADNPDARPAFDDVLHLRSTRRVLDETLRMWPTAPGFSRTPKHPTTVHGIEMRPGDEVILQIMRIHRDPAVWSDPDTFDPDRFLPERAQGRPAAAYRPFGTGARACIGRQFAMHEGAMALAMILRRYDLVPEPGYRFAVTERLTLSPKNLRLRLRRREPNGDRRPVLTNGAHQP